MIKFTAPDGHPVWVMKGWIQAIRKPTPWEYNKNTRAVLILSGVNQAVCETPESIIDSLKE